MGAVEAEQKRQGAEQERQARAQRNILRHQREGDEMVKVISLENGLGLS